MQCQTNFGYSWFKPSHLTLRRLSRAEVMQPVPHPRWELSLSPGASYPATLHPTKSHQVSTWTYPTCTQGERGCHGCLFLCWKGSILTSCHRQAEKVPHWLASQWQQKQPNPWHVASARPSCPSPSPSMMCLPPLLQPRRASDLTKGVTKGVLQPRTLIAQTGSD